MTIQPILFPLNIGLATELRTYVLEHTDNGTSVNVHYHFLDVTKNTTLASGGILPYRILHGNNVILTGQDYLDYKADVTSIDVTIANLLGAIPVIAE